MTTSSTSGVDLTAFPEAPPRHPHVATKAAAKTNVWSAALSQAKNDGDRLVCANVYGLDWSVFFRALMECAALSPQ